MATVRVSKQKYPARAHMASALELWCVDDFGTWLYRPRDAALDRVGVQLMPVHRWWTAWWWIGWENDPSRRWIAVDVCTPPALEGAGWRYEDLEIDVVRQSDGSVSVLDEDEFEEARLAVPYPPKIVATALHARDEVHQMLRQDIEPFRSCGWRHIEAAVAAHI